MEKTTVKNPKGNSGKKETQYNKTKYLGLDQKICHQREANKHYKEEFKITSSLT